MVQEANTTNSANNQDTNQNQESKTFLDFKAIQNKWQATWKENKTFQDELTKEDLSKPKYYLTTPYPYMSGLLHLGHLFTYMAPEMVSRYKRMTGHNVLFKYAFHCTGTPIVAAAGRVKEGEPTQIATLKKMGIKEDQIPKFADPYYWCEYFPEQTLKDLTEIGFTLDPRYSFKTTHLNPPYDKFITWQMNKLKELGYIKKGKHPVMWCPKDNVPVGDHDRSEGEGETPQEFVLFKHKLENTSENPVFVITATLRPDTVLGITNLYIHPELEYVKAQVNDGIWILSEHSLKALETQGHEVKILETIKGIDLIGKKVQEFDQSLVPILPATFIDPNFGTGIVHSVPSDSADDLIALQDLQKNQKTIQKYNLNEEEIKAIKPIAVLDTPELGSIAAQTLLDKYKVQSQKEAEKLKKIKNELYKISHHTATFNEKYKDVFSEDLVGKKVDYGKDIIKQDLIAKGFATQFYQATGKVVCRCLTECIIKVVSDQWFMEYNDKDWKKITHECLDNIQLYPEKVRKQFDYVLDWLHHWACTREFGLGTKLPWDHTWVVESLSDSTIQMAYATISKYLQHPEMFGINESSIDLLDDKFFNYIFSEEKSQTTAQEISNKTSIPEKLIQKMHDEFNYWYPFDFRNSAKDLLQNHMAFCLFNHTALFPKKHWPQSYVLNGRIMINNEKMSKSKGNFFTIRELNQKHGADIIRITAANAGEGVDDANFDMTFLETAKHKLNEIYEFAKLNYNKDSHRSDKRGIDAWFDNAINTCIQNATTNMDNMLFKSVVQASLMDMQRHLKWYLRRTGGSFNKEIINKYVTSQLKLLTPFTPHFCEEVWATLGNETLISNESWPNAGSIDSSADASEELIKTALEGMRKVLKLAKIEEPKKYQLFVANSWKYEAIKTIKAKLSETRNVGEIIPHVLSNKDFKPYAKEISKMIPGFVKNPAKIPETITSQDQEFDALNAAAKFLQSEFACEVEVIKADSSQSQHAKAGAASPGRPGIVVE